MPPRAISIPFLRQISSATGSPLGDSASNFFAKATDVASLPVGGGVKEISMIGRGGRGRLVEDHDVKLNRWDELTVDCDDCVPREHEAGGVARVVGLAWLILFLLWEWRNQNRAVDVLEGSESLRTLAFRIRQADGDEVAALLEFGMALSQ